MTSDRAFLKKAIVGLLDAIAQEQSPGHQESKAGRYVLISSDGTHIEVMFEKNEKAPPNIWCLERVAGAALIRAVPSRRSSASDLRAERAKNGELLYGRHSALEKMRQLGEGDLVLRPRDARAGRSNHRPATLRHRRRLAVTSYGPR